MAEAIEPFLEERGMPEEKASERARNAAKRIRTSKQTGKRIDAKPAKPSRNESAAPPSPQKEAEEQLSKPSSENAYTPASPYRKKKTGGSKK